MIADQTAWAHDSAGPEAAAALFCERALAGEDMSTEDRHGVSVGLGRYDELLEMLRRGLGEFPDEAALRTFLAMALYDVGVRRYRRAVEYCADRLDDSERGLLTPCQRSLTFTS
ncbi:hypothetical protein P3102_13990 [Amycolatopsis sp. QT-25]|uniref:hypothetical protein n=1 Tax=Amycolatopsis sp. QT-25 TaxID=3034022 RepID=UPI0023EA9467|nr:hypothetical protein [Amycolatopsis sp. QT-25]WET82225.1 hypothetical protein P3102_13990 [Amycolatopsis sp. QT-25]